MGLDDKPVNQLTEIKVVVFHTKVQQAHKYVVIKKMPQNSHLFKKYECLNNVTIPCASSNKYAP
uniref:Uncharacterized protein n=1 Tax=Arundo donax TaxID=35708 RepID=A0A0A9GE15_ARUDO